MAEAAELQKLHNQVANDPEEFENWEKLIAALEAQEGGLNRNSSPQAITTTRDTYDRFLARFPLFFGYWKKYAELEFQIAGTEAAEMVYERGVASIGVSVDLWTNYCAFKVETCHDADLTRELFERAAASCGLDFLAHIFWDKYIEFEERVESPDQIFAILSRIIHMPLHAYARYFERYRNMAASRPVDELAAPELIQNISNEIANEGLGNGNPAEQERHLRERIDAHHFKIFERTQAEVTRRWTYESEIKRPYYHVTELDEQQLSNWRSYLDFESGEGDYERIKFLYERCLVTCANYVEFWFRYARWMVAQAHNGKDANLCKEETRNIYRRACAIYVPINQPEIRLQYAHFEEALGRADIAIEIHTAILAHMPDHLEAIVSLVNTHRRFEGIASALNVMQGCIDAAKDNPSLKGALIAEQARLVWKIQGDAEEARSIFAQNKMRVLESEVFWTAFLKFELQQTTSQKKEPIRYQNAKQVIDDIRGKSALPSASIAALCKTYMAYLEERGGKNAMQEWIELDREVNGPFDATAKVNLEDEGKVANGNR